LNWRQWLGLKPTEADLVRALLRTAQATGNTGWTYDAADSTLRSGEQVINLANIHCEYAQRHATSAPRCYRNTTPCSRRRCKPKSRTFGPSRKPASSPS